MSVALPCSDLTTRLFRTRVMTLTTIVCPPAAHPSSTAPCKRRRACGGRACNAMRAVPLGNTAQGQCVMSVAPAQLPIQGLYTSPKGAWTTHSRVLNNVLLAAMTATASESANHIHLHHAWQTNTWWTERTYMTPSAQIAPRVTAPGWCRRADHPRTQRASRAGRRRQARHGASRTARLRVGRIGCGTGTYNNASFATDTFARQGKN